MYQSIYMFTRDEFRQVKPLKCFLKKKTQYYQWLFVAHNEEITLDTPFLAVREDFDEFDAFAEQLEDNNIRSFLSTTQLEDIVENLRLQKAKYTDEELLAAISFYWKNDAFITLE